MDGKKLIKIMLEIEGKCNSTLVLYLLNISVLSVKEESAASVGLAGPARKFLNIFCAVLLFISEPWMSYCAAFHDTVAFP